MKNTKKERIDVVLVSRGFAESRTKAQGLLMAGRVIAGEARVDKPGAMVRLDVPIEIKGDGCEWVGRGAYKLLKALDSFEVAVERRVCVDVGASTGGFTQALLSRGAGLVYSVDVGYGQLAWQLRNDSRVVVMERTNARDLTPGSFPVAPDLAVMDASFISLRLLLPPVDRCVSERGEAVVLVKPQFEVGRDGVGKGGRVRSRDAHIAVLAGLMDFASESTSFSPFGLTFSPVTGAKGNIEYLLYLKKYQRAPSLPSADSVVEEAHAYFSKDRGGDDHE